MGDDGHKDRGGHDDGDNDRHDDGDYYSAGRPVVAGGVEASAASVTRGSVTVRGMVRDVQARSGRSWWHRSPVQVVSFRVDPYDSVGNRLPAVACEIRTADIAGHLGEGDEAVVHGRTRRGVVHAKRIENRSSSSGFGADRSWLRVGFAALVLAVVVAGAWAGVAWARGLASGGLPVLLPSTPPFPFPTGTAPTTLPSATGEQPTSPSSASMPIVSLPTPTNDGSLRAPPAPPAPSSPPAPPTSNGPTTPPSTQPVTLPVRPILSPHCAASALSATVQLTSRTAADVVVMNTTTSSCLLSGFPTIGLSAGFVPLVVHTAPTGAGAGATVVLAPSEHAYVVVTWMGSGSGCAAATVIRVTPSGATSAVPADVRAEVCEDGADGYPVQSSGFTSGTVPTLPPWQQAGGS
ncbi:DUF4232 domain-containing protein [Lapillicoccus sp.]|uniref:DUF4232 domain-containing protein n=1 Tax=Lapillicoccus sp. TaxID=1909287 RepID=UPI00326616A4